MTYPTSSAVRRSSRWDRGFQPEVPAPQGPEPYRPDTRGRPLPKPANLNRGRVYDINRRLRAGRRLGSMFAYGFAIELGWMIGNKLADQYLDSDKEIYRQPNPHNVPAPYPAAGTWSHHWQCPKTADTQRMFWKPHASWNDTLRCLSAQAQFATAGSVIVEGAPGVGTIYNYAGDGVPFAVHGAAGTYHMILWNQYCVGVGCATSRSQEIAHVGMSFSAGEPYRLWAGSPWWMPAVLPTVNPALLPEALPINRPVAVPKPMPFRAVPYMPVWNPWAPTRMPVRGPLPVAAALPHSPWENGVVIRPGVPVKPAAPHERRPPSRGEKERKPGRDAKPLVDRIVGPATEATDAIAAVYSALPWSVRQDAYQECLWGPGGLGDARKCMSPQRKLRVIYDNAHRLDMAKVVENLAKNHLEDRVIGELSRRADRNLRGRGWHDRFGRGPTSGPAL